MERIREELTKIQESQDPKAFLLEMGRIYSDMMQWNTDEIFAHLNDLSFWQADYLGKEKEGKEWGMSTKDAFRCLVDSERTLTLFKGIQESMNILKARNQGPIVGIDAGTGTGILAMFLVLQGAEKVHALEINTETATVAQKFIDKCGFSKEIELIVGDATKLDLPTLRNNPANIILSENLSSGLFDEPQYQIINHLSQFIKEDALIVPYKAEVFVSLANADWSEVPAEKNNIAARRLKRCDMASTKYHLSTVESVRNMIVPHIEGDISIPIGAFKQSINTLIFSTRFQINSAGYPSFLHPDTAEFLGKSSAFRLPENFQGGSRIQIEVSYNAGFARNQRNLTVEGNRIIFKEV